MKIHITLFFCILLNVAFAQNFSIINSKVFKTGKASKKIILLQNKQTNRNIIVFKTDLAVNTDGIPISYHPLHLRGDSPAINTILNAIFVYRIHDNFNLSVPRKNKNAPKAGYPKDSVRKWNSEAYSVIERWRDSNYETIPAGYKFSRWQNILGSEDGKKPCVLSEGKYKGFFASLTSQKQGINTNKGECDYKDQLNAFEIPALVLAKNSKTFGANPVRTFKGDIGDLVIAFNPVNNKIVFAIVGDTGPEDNLGEGSVILNMKLRNDTIFPTNLKTTYKKAIGTPIVICIIPNTKRYITKRPYTQENIEEFVWNWLKENNINSNEELLAFLNTQKENLK